jgi:hypothetical protein
MNHSLKTESDISCPKRGELIPEPWVSKWSDDLYLVPCPWCHVMHEFTPAKQAKK